jgi:ribosomal protein S18 acetylase RimI-like enzyme
VTAFAIRPYEARDLVSLYEICLQTGDAGEDASHLYRDPRALGYLYAAPYAVREPELAFLLEDEAGACGYILGTADTLAFDDWLSESWFPELRKSLPEPTGNPQEFSADERVYWQIHHPSFYHAEALDIYPAHLHIDLLSRAQGQGQGRRLMNVFLETLRDRGIPGVHLGLAKRNARALRFYQKVGFTVISAAQSDTTMMMGKRLDGA